MTASSSGIDNEKIVIRADVDREVLEAFRVAFGMRRLAYLTPSKGGSLELKALLGEKDTADAPEGRVVKDLGAAATVFSSGQPAVFNPESVLPLRTPYSAAGVPSSGALAVPFLGGLIWADRRERPVEDSDFLGFVRMCSLVEAASGNARDMRATVRRVEYLTAVLEGLRGILASKTEQECVARLVETAARQTGAAIGVVALFGTAQSEAAVVGAFGPVGAALLGKSFDTATGLVGLAMRSGTAVPSGGRFSRTMRPILGPGVDFPLSEEDGLIVQPISPGEDPVGALVLAEGGFDGPLVAHGIRTLCDSAGLLLQRFRMQARMERDSMMDGLTGLYNRQALMVRLSEIFAFCKRHGHELCLLMIDADHFKNVNDTHGHLVGDKVLRFITDTIRRALRESDMAGRYGGEEFCVLLPHTGSEGARLVAERIREWCAASALPVGLDKLCVTVSIGVAHLSPEMTGSLDLIASADKAMYEAKNSGRNRVVIDCTGSKPH